MGQARKRPNLRRPPAAALAAANAEPPSFKGQKNIYVCQECCGHIVSVDLDEGVTPFMIGCEATLTCKGWMQSSFYRVFDQKMRASHEWYKPPEPEIAAMSVAMQDHVRKGGLVMRRATGASEATAVTSGRERTTPKESKTDG